VSRQAGSYRNAADALQYSKEHDMNDRDNKKTDAGAHRFEHGRSKEHNKGAEKDIDCRCKEAEGKTIPQLFKIMVKDLAFWKKDNR
jgi:hypothetical protein